MNEYTTQTTQYILTTPGKELKRARNLLRVGVVGHFWAIIFDLRYPGDKTAVYEISLVAEKVDDEITASARSWR